MKIIPLRPPSFSANTYLIASGGEAWIVDPAVSADSIRHALETAQVTPLGILLTHGHFDHTVALDALRADLGIAAYLHRGDRDMLTDGQKNGFYDFFGREQTYLPAEEDLFDGQRIPIGGEQIEVIHTPGHSKGSVCFLCGDALLTGDTLFADSVGRWDLWGGNSAELKSSLNRLRTLEDHFTIYPGHGTTATLLDALEQSAYFL